MRNGFCVKVFKTTLYIFIQNKIVAITVKSFVEHDVYKNGFKFTVTKNDILTA